jgi:SAM-dependent methyltransferase
VTAPGVEVDPDILAAVAHEMAGTGAEVIDLVPGDLSMERALRLLRRVDPARLASDPLYFPAGAHEAVALRSTTRDRMGLNEDELQATDRGELLRETVRAQRHAPTAAEVRLAPELHVTPQTPEDRWRELEEASASTKTVVALPALLSGLDTLHLVALTVGSVIAPAAGLAALAAWSTKPALVFGPNPPVGDPVPGLLPHDLGGLGASAVRLPRRWASNVRLLATGWQRRQAAAVQRAADGIPAVPALDELFEEPRGTCPACDTGDLIAVIDTPDLLQSKPGQFHLDRCCECGHVFQNPALSVVGLEYYYRDFYDGPSEELWEAAFAVGARDNGPRFRALGQFTEPQAWLDVGTGHAHFCLAARQEWPDAVFDGLDMGESVEEAGRRGWLDTVYRGMFPDLADGLPRSYDVVSMFHYLEHTRDPWREIEAAAKVVEPGGYLILEVPDPESPWGRRLGRYWFGWLQPQHQHFLPCENMVAALTGAGFEALSVERGAADMGNDLMLALALALQRVAPSPHAPWLPPASVSTRARRIAAIVAAIPLAVTAVVGDRIKGARLDPDEPANAYRIVARRI